MGIFTRLLQGVQAFCILRGTDRPLQTDCRRRLMPSIRLPVSQFSGLATSQGWEEGQALVVWLRAPHDLVPDSVTVVCDSVTVVLGVLIREPAKS